MGESIFDWWSSAAPIPIISGTGTDYIGGGGGGGIISVCPVHLFGGLFSYFWNVENID